MPVSQYTQMHLVALKRMRLGELATKGTIGEGKGPVLIPNRKGASP